MVSWVSGSTEVALSVGAVETTVGPIASVVVNAQLVIKRFSSGFPDSSVIESPTRVAVWIIPEARELFGAKVAVTLLEE